MSLVATRAPRRPRAGAAGGRGATQADLEAALGAWIAATGDRDYFASSFGDDLGWAPSLDAALHAMRNGGRVVLRLGRYRPATWTVHGSAVPVLERTGGRWVLMRGHGPGGLAFADPHRPRRSETARSLQPVTAVYGSRDPDGTERLHRDLRADGRGMVSLPTATFPRLRDVSCTEDGDPSYVEGWTVLRPTWTLSLLDRQLVYADRARVRRWRLPHGSLGDAQVSPAGDAVYYAMAGSRTIWEADLVTGATRRFAVVPAPVLWLSVRGDRVLARTRDDAGTTVTSAGAVLRRVAARTTPPAGSTAPVAPSPGHACLVRRSASIRAKGIDAGLGGDRILRGHGDEGLPAGLVARARARA